MPKGQHKNDDLRVKTKGKDAAGKTVLTLEPEIVPQHEVRIAYLMACVEALATKAGVTLPTPPAGYIAP